MNRLNLAEKLIESHKISGSNQPGEEISLRVDQALIQDATGTLVCLELEKLGVDQISIETASVYVDHNLIQVDSKNPDDHLFLKSAAQKFGLLFSRPGNGISHVVHMNHLSKPGEFLLGADSHTCASGAIGMLAIGTGGLDVAMAMISEPYYLVRPKVMGIYLEGELSDWVSAKNVILEMLKRHGVRGGVGKILEYHGPGVKNLSAMDRHVICNMGAELGATTSVFPSDQRTKEFLKQNHRSKDYKELSADKDCNYDEEDRIDLSKLVPLIAMPPSPGNVVTVEEVEGTEIHQAYIGSSANPGYRDYAISAQIVSGKRVADHLSFDINFSSREVMNSMAKSGHLSSLLSAGARIHQVGCNGCIGMGQAPAYDTNSLRTVPRNFPGRSGTEDDKVWLTSPEVAAYSALQGEIADPRRQEGKAKKINIPVKTANKEIYLKPLSKNKADEAKLEKGRNVKSLPDLDPLEDSLSTEIALKVQDDVSTDEILPAGSEVLPYRSNIQKISEFTFKDLAPDYVERAEKIKGPHAIIAGSNYGQGSSREHAALAPAFLGLKLVIAKGYSRIHWQNLVSFGVLPLQFKNEEDYENVQQGDKLEIKNLHDQIKNGKTVEIIFKEETLELHHSLSSRQIEILMAGGLLNSKRVDT